MSEQHQEPEHVDEEDPERGEAEPLPDRKAMPFLDLGAPLSGTVTRPVEPTSPE